MGFRLKLLLVLGAALALVAAGCGGNGKLGAKALSEHSKSLASSAAEGALLAEDASAGRTTGIYLREHAADLSGAVSGETASLTKAKTDPELEPRLRALTRLAGRVDSDLRQLAGAPRDRQRALARELERIAKGLEAS